MSETFYTILTTVGQAKIANAQVTGQNVNLTEIAVGDGGGSYYNPDQTQTALKNEVWRGNIGAVQIDDENPNWIVIEGVIPANVGGFFVREVGIFDDAGDMVAVGKFPETYKPVMAQGSAKDLYLRVIIEVTNVSAVTLRVDPSVIIASRKYVDEKIGPVEQKANQNAASILQLQQQVNAHLNDDTAHGVDTKVSKSGDTMTGSLSTTSAFPFYIKLSGKKTWGFHRSGDNLYIAPSASNDGTDLDWSKQTVFYPDGKVSFSGIVDAKGNTSYTTRQMRSIILSTSDPNVSAMQDGDLWVKYKP